MVAVLELKLNGAIGEGRSISLGSIREQLAAKSFDAIHIEINSMGGCAAESFSIYTALRALPAPIAATATGACHSGGLLVYMSASLRKATAAAEFIMHPASTDRDTLPERVTAQILQNHAETLAKIDRRSVDLFAARTGFDREWFEREISTEDALSDADAIQTGIVHELAGVTPLCDPAWPDTAQRVMKEARHVYLPSQLTTQGYYSACRCAAFFRTESKSEIAKFVPRVVSF